MARLRRELLLLAAASVLGVLAVTSASGGRSVSPGRNGKILMAHCYGKAADGAVIYCRRLALMNPDGSGYRLLAPNTSVDKGLTGFSWRWSHDGRRLLAGGRELGSYNPGTIHLLTAQGREIRTIFSRERSRRLKIGDASPDWLQGEKRLAFVGNTLLKSGIYTIGVDGTGLRKVRTFRNRGEYPDVHALATSPDGRRIAFLRLISRGPPTDDQQYGLFVMNANGTGLRLLTRACQWGALDWAPDGKRLLLSMWQPDDARKEPCADSPLYGIYTVSLAGGPPERIYTPQYNDITPLVSFSPDGTDIVVAAHTSYFGNGGVPDAVVVMRPDGSGVKTLRQAHPGEGQILGDIPLSWQPRPR